MLGRGQRLIRRRRNGEYELHLSGEERELMKSLVPQLRELLAAGAGGGPEQPVDESLTRLFPTVYADEDLEAEYQRLVRDELLEKRLAALDVVEATADEERVTEEQLLQWMGSVNSLRLVLGTRLDVTEDMDAIDPDDPNALLLGIYGYLGWLLEHIVEALSER
ncbi:MAG TPA: DUF2017 family protein [Acidimicrobiales bacterium]|nr:DUF2017 family protein [Acidimicrobiales bacterium]